MPGRPELFLAGDVGGTNARLALFSFEEDRPALEALEIFPSRHHADLGEIVEAFKAGHPEKVVSACFGVAGPIKENRAIVSNLPWIVEAGELADRLGLPSVALINDLEANAAGIAALRPEDFLVLNPGAPSARGNRALLSAGTGLGEAGLPWNGSTWIPMASEGGHSDFAPRTDLEIALLRWLMAEYGRVSYERVLSGKGLHNIYRFLRESGLGGPSEELDSPAAVSKAALDGSSPLAAQALDVFVSIYGAEAGNLALKFLASGGIYIGGGIAPKIIEKLKGPAFMSAFLDKGRLRPFLESVPVRVILNDRTALLGAASEAHRRLSWRH